MILLKQMIIFFLIMILGYGMAKKGILDKKTCNAISGIIVNIANPALIISGSLGNSIERNKLLFVLAVAFGMYVLLIIVAEMLIPLFKFGKADEGVYKVLLIFTNMGFMGFPILSAMYGSEALLYGAVFLLPFNLLIYTYGIFRLSGGVGAWKENLKKCLNTGVIAVIFTLFIAMFHISIPYIATQIIEMLSNLTAPLCMMVIGASFVRIYFKEMCCDIKLLIFSIFRLIVIPVIFMMIFRMITNDVLLQNVMFIVIATPSGSMAAMLAQQYGGDGILASKGIALTTFLSVFTMPLLFFVLSIS